MNKILLLLLLFTVLSCENLNFSSNYNSEDYIGMYKQRESNFIELRKDSTFTELINEIKNEGNWIPITDLGEYKLISSHPKENPKLLKLLYSNKSEKIMQVSTRNQEYGNCREKYFIREIDNIDTILASKSIVQEYNLPYFGKKSNIINKNFDGCNGTVSKIYRESVENEYGENIGNINIDIKYNETNKNGSWKMNANWNNMYSRFMPKTGSGEITKDTLYSFPNGIKLVHGKIVKDTFCCKHRLEFVIQNKICVLY